MKIGIRLGMGFSVILALMTLLISVAIFQLATIGDSADKMTSEEWVKSKAANTINGAIRANARRTLELFVAPDKNHANIIRQKIDFNKNIIESAVATLEKLISRPEGKALLAKFKEERARYVASFTKVAKLIEESKQDEAANTAVAETLPALDLVQETVSQILLLQDKVVEERGAEIIEKINITNKASVGLGIAAVLIGIGLAFGITRSITRPIGEAVKIAQTVAAGDLTAQIETDAKDETGDLLLALKDMNDSLVRIVREVRAGTDTIATASSQIAAGNLDLSSRTEEQASSLEETASSMEELTSTVRQNADNARHADQLAVSASDVAIKGGTVMIQVVDTMGSISESAKKIAEIIGVIDGIAFQTNILALNAAVEAARAGEQGRGFAVVASEVRNLAQRSAGAAKEIKILINDSVEKVDAGSRLVDQAGTTMDEVVASVKRVSDIIGEITAASQEQSAGIEQINKAITQMDEVTQQNASLVEEAAAAAGSLQDQASNLAQVVSVFKLKAGHTTDKATLASKPMRASPKRIAIAPTRDRERSTRSVPSVKKVSNGASSPAGDWEEF